MTYSVKEIFYTLQGEGAQAGRAAVFCRFAGCNLWSGREADRERAICRFCDTDFVGVNGQGGGKYQSAQALASHINANWPAHDRGNNSAHKYVVCTGGEPLLQLDAALIDALHEHGFTIAVETNGTIAAPQGIDWLCVSPKADAELIIQAGNELKLVVPQPEHSLERIAQFAKLQFDYFFVQPMDGPKLAQNTRHAIEFCRANPAWRLSLQSHKILQIP